MNEYIESRRTLVENSLNLLDSELNDPLIPSGLYALSNGGKRLRPLLCIFICELLGGKPDETISSSVALELIHNATLVHDDILDDDRFRRGTLSTPNKYGIKTAVITGDALLSLGLKYAASTGNTQIVEWLSDTSLKMVTGIKKQIDINGRITSPEEFLEINYLKSGSLFEAACAIGALTASGSENDITVLARFGKLFGDAYQIKDDLNDAENLKEKGSRSDLENGDITLPVIYAIQSDILSTEERRILTNGLGDLSKRGSVTAILEKTGANEKCRDLVKRFLNEAEEILDQYPDSDSKKGLKDLLGELRV